MSIDNDINVSSIDEDIIVEKERTSLSFSIDLERTLNYLVEHNDYFAKIRKTMIRYIGEKEDTINGKRQVFEIERQVELLQESEDK